MSESLASQALKANKEYPHMDQQDIVFDLLDIEKRLDGIESNKSTEIPDLTSLEARVKKLEGNTIVMEGMSQEINWLKEELTKAWNRIISLEKQECVKPVDNTENAS